MIVPSVGHVLQRGEHLSYLGESTGLELLLWIRSALAAVPPIAAVVAFYLVLFILFMSRRRRRRCPTSLSIRMLSTFHIFIDGGVGGINFRFEVGDAQRLVPPPKLPVNGVSFNCIPVGGGVEPPICLVVPRINLGQLWEWKRKVILRRL